MAAATEKTETTPVQPTIKGTEPIFYNYKDTADGTIWGSLKSQGQKIPICTKCGSKRLVESAEVESGVVIAKLRCPNNDPNCSFVKDYTPNERPSSVRK